MMGSCPRCSEPVGATDRFCEACGTDLQVRRGGTVAAMSTGRDRSCRGCDDAVQPDSEYCCTCGLRHRDGADRVELELGALAGVSDRGRVHARNEDAMAIGQRTGAEGRVAAVVCDGVSHSELPERAARAAAEAGLDVLLGVPDDTTTAPQLTRDAVAAAARAVTALAPNGGRDGPSCTLVAALVDRSGPEITVGWVGDSRAYWLAEPGGAEPARVLTVDHSWAVEAVAAGLLDATAATADHRAHAITRWLGPDGEPEPEVVTVRPAGPGVLLLCSDGLWNYLPDATELAAVALAGGAPAGDAGGPLGAAVTLTAVALDAGGRDNITVVVIPVAAPSPSPVRSPS